MKDNKKRTCMKVVAYIYLPKDEDYDGLDPSAAMKLIRYHDKHRNGRLKIYDDFNNEVVTGRDMAFDNYGEFLSMVEEEYRKRSDSRLKVLERIAGSGMPGNEEKG